MSPTSEQELAEALRDCAAARETLRLGGGFSKNHMGGQVREANRTLSSAAMNRVLKYEPRDLTLSVEAGMPWSQLCRILADNQQMIPLDPPYFDSATVGGVIAANTCGPRRRQYGSARDVVIGMRFATMEGKIVQSGGMVVKNVAGLDMAKLMIGSFGTLAAISVVNFKLAPVPVESETFVLQFADAAACLDARDRVLKGVLQPAAIDVLNPAAARRIGRDGYMLLIHAGGNHAMLARYASELGVAGQPDFDWSAIREFTPRFVAACPSACVARVSSTLTEVRELLTSIAAPIVSRAGNGVSYVHFSSPEQAVLPNQWRHVFEYGPSRDARVFEDGGFKIMLGLKEMFDPHRLLNPGRLYGRI